MIDTCGLPMKFVFHVAGREKKYLIDFTNVVRGNPHLCAIGDLDGTYGWTPYEIAKHIQGGRWIIDETIEPGCIVDVEDLL